MRDRDVQAFAAGALKLADRGLQILRRNLEQLVLHMLPGLQGEQPMYDRRTAVRDGIAHHAITIYGCRLSLQNDLSRSPR